ncbi:hypothetical protein ACH49_26025 [Streptomyces leeuwenhoekii]|uniref:WGR domain-containing protein n=1 Tax=Streptomyces leeuwenhoekii TaxID=1437453 RepID=A0ABR5HS62_STRLW|nr:hypothetical protein [Streptomyces leeuwenhoekii]KMS69798.1 hypothetical protein ACH49_26025 [Streptomyces leeuwenhoekii]
MQAHITITECVTHNAFERNVIGWRWWWQTVVLGRGVRSGFTRTEEKARARAEEAARKLAAGRVEYRETYTITADPGARAWRRGR